MEYRAVTVLFICRQRAKLQKSHGRLVVSDQGLKLGAFPIMELDQVLIYGNATVTAPAAQLLLRSAVPVSYFSLHGQYLGSLRPQSLGNGRRILAQVQILESVELSLAFVRSIVQDKLNSQIEVLKSKREPECRAAYRRLNQYYNQSANAANIDQLRGIEGAAAQEYFKAYASLLNDSTFKIRQRRPPPDPINSMLSLCYSILASEIEGLLLAADLVPSLGLLHTRRAGRAALAFDIMEPFRSEVDQFVLKRWNLKQVTSDAFNETPKGCRFKRPELARFLKAWNTHLNSGEFSIRQRMQKSCFGWRRAILNQDPEKRKQSQIECIEADPEVS